MRKLRIIFAILIVLPIAFSLSINTTNIVDTVNAQKTYYFKVSNPSNNTYSCTISKEGEISNYLYLSTNYFTLNQYSDYEFNVLFIPGPEKTYIGKIKVSCDGNELETNLNITYSKYLYSKTIFVKSGEMYNVNGIKLSIIEVKDNGVIAKINDVEHFLGTYKNDIEISFVESFLEYAKLIIKSNKEIKIEKSYQVGELVPLQEKIILRIAQNVFKKIYISVLNNLPFNCVAKDVVVSGDSVLTEEGRKPLDVEAVLGTIKPNEIFTYTVILNTKDVEPGSYNIETNLVAICNNKRYDAKTIFEINVVRTIAKEETASLLVEYPKKVNVNETFEIKINSKDVILWQLPEMITESFEKTKDGYIWKGRIVKPGTYNIQVTLIKEGIATNNYLTIEVVTKEMKANIIISPENPRIDDLINVQAQCDSSNVPITVSVYEKDKLLGKYTYSTPIKAEKGKKYCFSIECGEKIEKCVEVGKKFANIVIDGDIKYNNQITIKYVDSLGNLIPADIKINGNPYKNPATITLTSEIYNIFAESEDYESVTKTINVIIPKIESYNVSGNMVYVMFNAPFSWQITKDGKTIRSGFGKEIFEKLDYGDYDLIVEGNKMAQISIPFSISTNMIILILSLVFLFAIFIGIKIYNKMKEREERRIGYDFLEKA